MMGEHLCLDNLSTINHGPDTGAANAAAEQDAKTLVDLVMDSALPFWLASEPDGRACGPDLNFLPGTVIAFVRLPGHEHEDIPSTCLAGIQLQLGIVYMFTSSLDEQCYYWRADISDIPPSDSACSVPWTWPSTSTSPDSGTDDQPEDEEEEEVENNETSSGSDIMDDNDNDSGSNNNDGVFDAVSPAQAATPSNARPPTFAVASPTPEENNDRPDGGEDDGDDAPACFPGWAGVTLASGRRIAMRDLSVGDAVVSGPLNRTSEVFMFSHREESAGAAYYVTLRTDGGHSVTLTPGHLMQVLRAAADEDGESGWRLRPAGSVRTGDGVQTTSSSMARVTYVGRRKARWGLYNPHTLDGDVVVDGVCTSTFTTGVGQAAAAALMAPFRATFKCGRPMEWEWIERGSDWARGGLWRLVGLGTP